MIVDHLPWFAAQISIFHFFMDTFAYGLMTLGYLVLFIKSLGL
jgi:hypothetical protein